MINKNITKKCKCGCGTDISTFDKNGREKFYVNHHAVKDNRIKDRMGAKKGSIPLNKGKIGLQVGWCKGKKRGPLSKEHKKNMSKSLTGMKYKKWSEESRKKMSISRKGKPSPLKGKKNIKTTGEKNKNWKGGISPINKRIRNSSEYSIWRYNIFQRDDYTCKECKKRGVKMVVHHLNPFCEILKENKINSIKKAIYCRQLWDESNGITLCNECHYKIDYYLNKRKKT